MTIKRDFISTYKPFRNVLSIWIFVLVFLTDSFSQQVNFRNYSVGDGLAQSQIFDMVEDDYGYIWFATRGGGLSRFDGLNFTGYTTRNGLINDFIYCLVKTKSGSIAIGTNLGLSIYDGKTFKNYKIEEKGLGVTVNAIFEDKNQRLWLATSRGIYYKENEKITCYSCYHNLNRAVISCIFVDEENKLWYGDDFGLNLVDTIAGKINSKMYRGKDGFTNVLVRVIRKYNSSTLLIGTYGGGLFFFNKKTEKAIPIPFDLENKIIHDIEVDKKGNWWLATYAGGVYRFNVSDSSLTHFTENEGLANNHVSSIFEDSWGNIWLGTSGNGVSKYAGELFRHYTEKNGLLGNYVFTVCPEGDSVLWMGTSVKGVIRMNLQTEKIIHYSLDSGFIDEKVKTIYRDTNGTMWFGTEGQGLWRKDSTGFKQYKTTDGLSSNWIKGILRDDNNNLWLATAGGGITVLELLGDRIKANKIRDAEGSPRNRVNCLHKDQQGRIWFGTEGGGLGFVTGEEIKYFTINDGLSSNTIRSLKEDFNGVLWIATGGGGLSKIDLYRDFKIDRVTIDNGISSDNLYLLEIDDQNNLWIGSESGVDRIIINENSQVKEIKHYGKQEGFIGIETCQNAVCKSGDGSIWFGTINGLTQYNSTRNESNVIAPKLQFTAVNLYYQPLGATRFSSHVLSWNMFKDDLELNYTENHIGFDFIGIDHKNPSSVKYQWKLEGFDADWSPLSLKRDVTYSNLPPGTYSFLVRAFNEDGVPATKELKFDFTISPPYYQTWWFRLIVFTFIVFLIITIIFLFTRRYRLKTKAFRERLKIEKRMVELEQKALRLQMNPHFIFHALNSIQGLIGRSDEQTARKYLSKFSKLMRAILENSREQVISLDKEIQTLDNYLELEKFTRNDSFDYEIKVSEEIDAEEVFLPSMLLQPFVENSLIHGFTGLDRRGLIKIIFEREGNYLLCRLIDNGVGRTRANENKAQKESQHKSMALIVTQERLSLLNKESDNKDTGGILVIDLKDQSGMAEGTEVIIKILVD